MLLSLTSTVRFWESSESLASTRFSETGEEWKNTEAAFFLGGEMDVSENSGFPPPNHPILIGCSIINHPFWGSPIFGNTQMGRLESPTVSGTKNRGIFSRVPFLSVWHIFLGRSVKFPGSNTVHPQNLTCQKTPYILKGIAFFQTLILDIHVISSSQGCC